MAYHMTQEDPLRPSVMITLTRAMLAQSWANIANGSSTIRCWQLENAY